MPKGIFPHPLLSPEHKAKISASLIGNKRCLGYHPTPEALAHQSAAEKGHPVSAEQRAKVSIANTGKIRTPETRAKISAARSNPSPETRAKLSAAATGNTRCLGRRLSPETKAKIGAGHWTGGEKVANGRHGAKRRLMGYVYLNKWFAGCAGHHVDNEQIINMPRELHQGKGLCHNHYTGKGMALMNATAYNFLFKQELETALHAEAIPDWPLEVSAKDSIAD